MLGLSVPHDQQAVRNTLSETIVTRQLPQNIAEKHSSLQSPHGIVNDGDGVNNEVGSAPISHVPEIVVLEDNTEKLAEHGDCSRFSKLNPSVAPFRMRDPNLLHRGVLVPNLNLDWKHVQRVQLGGVGDSLPGDKFLWQSASKMDTEEGSNVLRDSGELQELPFHTAEDIPIVLGVAPKQIHKLGSLKDKFLKLPCGSLFTDKVLPAPEVELVVNDCFTPDYFIALHNIVSAPGIKPDGTTYQACTPNHLGARVQLPHVKLKIGRWRHHLFGYENVELIQHLEFGFPIGLDSTPDLESSTRNHGSAYQWFSHVDKFICTELREGGLTGPFKLGPWWNTVISPVMTAHKKPASRRTVFDATFGDKSINKSTPSDSYMGQPTHYTFPKIEDYKEMILTAGRGCWMWKRDLARFFLQLPLDPSEYHRVGLVWRGLFFFFLGLAFGLRHSGLSGQRVTDAISWILRGMGVGGHGRELQLCEDPNPPDKESQVPADKPYQVCNYVDDMGGVEGERARAEAAIKLLGLLLEDLGLDESKKKAEPPTTKITFLGVEFDSIAMTMSVPPAKLTEVKAEIRLWLRKTTICKKDLQSLLGKLFWVARCVKYARVFMGRLLAQLREMSNLKD